MSSLRQHFQHIKEIVDWSWTLAILCMVGYITLGQLVQLYWAMVVFGGIAGSFGLFYDFSCEKLAELGSLDGYKLQKAYTSAVTAQEMLTEFANRNPKIAQQSIFVQARQQVSNIRASSYDVAQQRVNQQRQSPPQRPTQPPVRPVQSRSTPPSPSRPIQPPVRPVQSRSTPPSPSRPIQPPARPVQTRPTSTPQPYIRATQARLSPEEFRFISNQSDYEYVKTHMRAGKRVKGYYRRKRKR